MMDALCEGAVVASSVIVRRIRRPGHPHVPELTQFLAIEIRNHRYRLVTLTP
jgi:hypothetical protein